MPPRQPIPVVHAVPAVPAAPRRTLNPDVAVVALCLVLYARGIGSFLWLFGAVLVLDDCSNLSQLAKGAFTAVIAVGDWLASMMPPPPRGPAPDAD